MKRLFGTDGVRGVANIELTPQLAYNLGYYGGKIFKSNQGQGVLVGRDTRFSGPMLMAALASGFMAAGLDVIDLGVVSTPCLAYLVKENDYCGGAVISASHNPFEYNGIKLFNKDGFKLTDEKEDQIQEMIEKGAKEERLSHDKLGRLIDGSHLIEDYENYLIDLGQGMLKGKKIAIDCGNGALYEMAPRVLEKMGAEIVAINTSPDGTNINKNCGSTNPHLIADLVREKNAEVGFSFDGDADRIIAVDGEGNIIDGDHMLAIFATDLERQGKFKNSTLVGTVMTNMGLDAYLEKIGGRVIRAQVGDRYVLEEMLKGDYVIGGEQSGHLIFLDHNTTGDGLASGIHLVNAITRLGQSAADLNKMVENWPQVLINAKVENSKKYQYMENQRVKEEIEKIEEVFGRTGRVVIRPSGTEPLVRVMIEGQNLETIEKTAKDLAKLIEDELK